MSENLDVFAGAMKPAQPQSAPAAEKAAAPNNAAPAQPASNANNAAAPNGGNAKKRFRNKRGGFNRNNGQPRPNNSPIRGANGEESVNPLLNAPLPTEQHEAEAAAPANPNRNPDMPEYRLSDIQIGRAHV